MGMLKNLMTVAGMRNQVVATDFLMSTKSAIIYTSLALTESATPELRDELEKQLFQAIDTHEAISTYMIEKDFYFPHDIQKEINLNIETANTATELAESNQRDDTPEPPVYT
jgi:similar to spore coat protein